MNRKYFGIGEVARRAGITVRTLRHYDAIGLLPPSHHTPAGHRQYGARELARLEQIRLLRQAGLVLDDIGKALDSRGNDLGSLLERQVKTVERRLQEDRLLLERLRFVVDRLKRGEVLATDDLMETLEVTAMFEKHFTRDQRERLARRREQLGEKGMQRAQQDWAELFRRFDACRQRGVTPESDELAPLVQQAKDLVAGFTGGEPDLAESLERVTSVTPAIHEIWGIDKALADYYFAVLRHHGP